MAKARDWLPRTMALAVAIASVAATMAAAPSPPARSVEEPLPFDPGPPAGVARDRVAALTALGRKLFNDASLSASGQLACSSCHDPAHAFGPPDAAPVRTGGARLDQPGTRAVPSLTYGQFAPFFDEHHYDEDEGDGGLDAGPTGGRTWDGRVNRARDQARIPLLAAHEMGNASTEAVVAAAAKGSYAQELRTLYGETIFADPERAFAALSEALEVYQEYPPEFSPFTSKYDAYLRGVTDLSATEARGLQAFNDPERGNCARCHLSRLGGRGALPLFTDFGMVAAAPPRNRAIPANSDPAHFDLGLCGPDRVDLARRADYCGLFKTPSLRNVALRKVFFHNGVFSSLREAVAFYADRDIHPERWYAPGRDGTVHRYDDLPPQYHGNVNVEAPFNRRPGDAPALTEQEIDDITAFLSTLTDGFPQTRAQSGIASRAADSVSTPRGIK